MSPRSRSTAVVSLVGVALILSACSDETPVAPDLTPLANVESMASPKGTFHRFVSIGTSISMGWQSDGVLGATQSQSWTAQLARLASRDQTSPLIGGFGCRAPLIAPLASGVRLSGEAAGAPPASFACAANEPGATIPSQNVAISAARTFDALNTTPENVADPFYQKLYPRILPPGTTQLEAALSQKPKFISVELGGNEVLDARSGIAIVGATITPYETWAPQYTLLTNKVASSVQQGILVGLLRDAASFPSFRRGAEIWNDRGALLVAFHVAVSNDCADSPNLVFVPVRIPVAVATGLQLKAAGQPPFVFSCAGAAPQVQDFVLTPDEVAVVNNQLTRMNAHIEITARRIGYAYMQLDVLYGRIDLKPPFSSVQLMTSSQPYGPLISLDGIHPNNFGHTVLAQAAARAINHRYGMGIPPTLPFIAGR